MKLKIKPCQVRKIHCLVRSSCANCDEDNCLLLDDGETHRCAQLTNLIPELLQMVDEKKIALTPAVEISYLTEQEQYDLLAEIERNDCTPSLSQACRFKKLSQENNLTKEQLSSIMLEDKANQKEMFKLPMERIQKIAPKISPSKMEAFVLKACEYYARFLDRQRDRDSR